MTTLGDDRLRNLAGKLLGSFGRGSDVDAIRRSGVFDELLYRSQLPAGAGVADAISHYVEFGERMGLSPWKDFDPFHYSRQYPDLEGYGRPLLLHYLRHGLREGRQGRPDQPQWVAWADDPDRPTVLVVVHELSRTGAPILAWNVVRRLKARGRRVAVVALRGGDLLEHFRAEADEVVEVAAEEKLDVLAGSVIGRCRPSYAICNSAATASFGQYLERLGVRTVGLIHEFGFPSMRTPGLAACLSGWSDVIFPAEIVRRSMADCFPDVALRRTQVLPQGKCVVPGNPAARQVDTAPVSLRKSYDYLVVGAGTVDYRKGVDLFLAAASAVAAAAPDLTVGFLWIGRRRAEDGIYLSMIEEQARRAGIADRFDLMDATEHVEAVYGAADAFFLSSRLDPMPNVCIDAGFAGLPVICFADASGTAELFAASEQCRELVVPHCDAHAAGTLIAGLARDRQRSRRLGNCVQNLSRRSFDMDRYVRAIDAAGLAAGQPQPLAEPAAQPQPEPEPEPEPA